MSYLELPAGISDCDKAVISLWFRVPDATLQAVLAQPDDPGKETDGFGFYLPPLYKVIPLLTFGSVETALEHHASGTYPSNPISPSFIGVDCWATTATADEGKAVLAVNLQMSNSTTFSGDFDPAGDVYRPDAFYMGGWSPEQMLEVTPDHWHHILISFDLSLGCSVFTPDIEHVGPPVITPGPAFTWAFDDEDKVGASMAESGGATFGGGAGTDDSIFPSYLLGIVPSIAPEGGITATWSPVPLAMEHSVATPTAAQFVDSVYPVELAELQFFAGVTLDTRTESNRRAFIDADGVPVPPVPPMIPNPDYDPDLPVSPSNPLEIPDPEGAPAEKLLHQPPDILFHGSGNWSLGKNTGPMIDNPDYDPDLPISATNPLKIPDPDFQFEPTGQIVAYTPDPSLHGPQSPEPPPAARRMSIHV